MVRYLVGVRRGNLIRDSCSKRTFEGYTEELERSLDHADVTVTAVWMMDLG